MPSAFSHDPSITVPGSSTDNAIAIFDGTGGSGFGNSTILVDSGGNGRIGIAGDTDVIIVTANTVTVAGTVAATTLTGAGSGITALAAGNIASGTVATARLGSGTANNTVFLRGDGTWAAAGSPGGSNTHVQYQSGGGFAGSANLIFDGTDTLTLSSTSTPELVINAPSGSNGVNMVMSCASGTTGSLLTRYKEGAANGTTNNMAYFLGYETGSNVFSLRSLDSDGSQTSAVVWQCHDGTGAITKPLQPAFLGRSSTTVSHTGNVDVVPISTMSKNVGSHFNNTGSTANGIPAYSFKAPVAGLYLFTCLMVISAKANATTRYEIRYTHDNSSGTDQGENFFARPWIGDTQPGEIRLSYSQLIYMAATDSVRLRGGGYGGTSTLNTYSWFSGHLVA
ncbi:tail fiber-like protein [uncultured Mediterranean phage]|nr:tail fiber-like protein [uncultured Mediterranean phage]